MENERFEAKEEFFRMLESKFDTFCRTKLIRDGDIRYLQLVCDECCEGLLDTSSVDSIYLYHTHNHGYISALISLYNENDITRVTDELATHFALCRLIGI